VTWVRRIRAAMDGGEAAVHRGKEEDQKHYLQTKNGLSAQLMKGKEHLVHTNVMT
jgi:hypothetical protein